MMALIWAQFRSYDMLDGAFYFLLYHNPADYSDTQTRFHLLGRPIWLLCGENIVVFRIVALALTSAACWLFWRAWRLLLSTSANGGVCRWPLWLAAMAGITWVPVALTYNSLATLFGLLGLAVVLRLFDPAAGPRGRRLSRWLMVLLLAGFFYGAFLAKAPAAAALAASSYFVICFEPKLRSGTRRVLIWLGVVAVAAIVGAVLAIIMRPGFDVAKYFNFSGLVFSPQWLFLTVQRYADEIHRMLPALRADFLWTVGAIALACGAALFGASTSASTRIWRASSLAFLLLSALVPLFKRGLWDGSYSTAVSGNAARFYLLLWGTLLPVWILCLLRQTRSVSKAPYQQIAWVIVLFALPLISSFGSTNPVYVCALHHTVFWAAGLLLVADFIGAAFAAPWFIYGAAAVLSAGAACHIFSGHFLRPYMYQPSLWKQTASVEVGSPATTLKVDPALAAFLREVRTTLDAHGYKPGDDAFGFFNLPGVVFAIGAREPGAPWFFGTWYHNDETDGVKLYPVPVKRRQDAWIVTQADVTRFRNQFLYFHIDFPNGYTKIGQTINPVSGLEVGIWKPRSRP